MGFIFFSRIVISRIYLPWKVINKKYFSWTVMRTLSPIRLCESVINFNSFFQIFIFWVVAQWVRQLDYLTNHTSLSPIRRGSLRLCRLQKGCTRLAAASDKVYQLLAHGRWFSPGTLTSSTPETGRHDIAELMLKVALKHKKSNQIKQTWIYLYFISK